MGVNDTMIKSVSESQSEILRSIITLYCPGGFGLDPTYSSGVFYKDIPKPMYRFDLHPVSDDVAECDCRRLPFPDSYLNSIVFDPPFIGASIRDGKTGIIKDRFSYFRNIPELWSFYRESLVEFYRILCQDGFLVFKCQDSVESRKQYFSHLAVANMAMGIGYYPKDLFILVAKTRIVSPSQLAQQHSRKYHSYFWVFQKCKCPVDYPRFGK